MSNVTAEPRLPYETRLTVANTGYARVDARWNLVANARLVAFLAAVAAAAWGLWGRAPAGWALAGLLLGVFVVLAFYHARLGRQRARLATLRAIQEEALARVDRRWGDLPMTWVPEVSPDHPYAGDLDIIGRASLFQLLDTTATRMGRRLWQPGCWLRRTRRRPAPGRARLPSWRPSSICGRRSSYGVAGHQAPKPIPSPSSPGRKISTGSAITRGCAGWPGSVRSRLSPSASRT